MRYFLILTTFSIWCTGTNAQELLSLKEVVAQYEENLNVKFSFDPELIDQIDSKFEYEQNFADFVAKVESVIPFSIKKIGENYYTINANQTEYSIKVSDTNSREYLQPEEIIVLVKGKRVTTTHENNQVLFNYKPSVSDTVMVYSVGYNKKLIPLKDLLNQFDHSIKIESPLMKLAEVTVEDYLTKGINLNPANQSITISVKDLPLLPGETDGDIFASLTALPGITNPDGRAGNLFVRGSDADQTMILFDNIPIYHRGHYYGTISPYNPKIVEDVEVYRNGFHPRFGGRVGGAIIINSDKDITTESTKGIGLNTLFGMGYAKVPLLKNKVGISIGVRHSYPSEFESPKLNAISESVFDGTGLVDTNGNFTGDVDVLFEDYNGKITYQIKDKSSLSLSGIYTNTDVKYMVDLVQNVPAFPQHSQYKNYGFNLDFKTELNETWNSNFSATFSEYSYSFITRLQNAPEPIYKAINELTDVNLRQEFTKKNEGLFWCQLGVDYKWQEALLDFSNIRAENDVYGVKNTTNSHSVSPFANFEYYGLDKWYFQMGLRGTYFGKLNVFNIAPRILVNYDPADWITFKTSIGLYNQYLSQVKNLEFGGGGFDNELWTLADNNQGHIIDGRQSMIGAVLHHKSWVFDIEAFSKSANNITIYEDRNLSETSGYYTMDQNNYGIDFLLKKQVGKDASMWIGYSRNDSDIKIDTLDQVLYKSKYVQPNVWYIGGALKRNRWKVSAGWKYATGLNAQSLDIIYTELLRLEMIANNPPPQGAPPPLDPFEGRAQRYSNMHSFDLSTSYKIPKCDKRKWSATFGISFVNLFNQQILVDQVFRGQQGFQDRDALGFAPNIMATIEW